MRSQALPQAVSQEAFPADPDFPQLRVASDPALMLEVFRAHLKPVAGRRYHIQECVPFRFRCRQSTSRCVLQYTLRVLEPSTGRRWDQGVTGLVYAQGGAAERLWQETQATDPRRGIPEEWLTFEPVDFIPDLQMVVQVFPYDRKLRNLSPVLGGALRGLEPVLLARLGPGQWHASAHVIEPARYRTELGAALKYTLRARDALTGNSETLRCYVKVYRNEQGRETLQLLESLAEHAARRRRPYSVVQPIAYLGELRTLVLEEARGAALREVLLGGSDPAAAMRTAARAVAAFNQDDLAVSQHQPLAAQLEDVSLAARLVQWACPETSADVAAITQALVAGLEEVPPAPIHGDLKPDHVFLTGDEVIFIDLDSTVLGDPVRDPAHLVAYVAGRIGMDALSPERARAAARSFLDEYFRHVPPAWRARFSLHCAGALVEVASAIFRRQERDWPNKVVAAVAEARRALAGGFGP